ncbi:MAG TPA: LysM domain-containing protein [Coriobacteriia bacterium]
MTHTRSRSIHHSHSTRTRQSSPHATDGTRQSASFATDALVVVAFAALLAGAGVLPTLADRVAVPASTRLVRVRASDTLWEIAESAAAPGVTTHRTVEEIRRINGLTSGRALQAGTLVRVPVAEAPASTFAMR